MPSLRVGAIAVVLEHEAVARIGGLERREPRRVAGPLRDLSPVLEPGVAVAGLLVALRRDVLREQLRDKLVVLRVRQAELEKRRALQARLRGLAHLVVRTGQLDKEPMVLHPLDDRLVRAHRVHAAADDGDNAVVAADERLLDLLLDCTRRVGDRRIRRDDRLGQPRRVHAQRERRAAVEVQPEPDLLGGRIADIEGDHGDKSQDQPLPNVIADNGFVSHFLLYPLF